MIRDLKAFYVAVINNEVICFETNLKLFVEELAKVVPDAGNYDWFYRQFRNASKFSKVYSDGELYYFQKVI